MDILEKLGTRIRDVRKKNKLTQDQFAKILEIGKSSVINYETAKRIPDAVLLIRIVDAFKIDPGWLLTGLGNMSGIKDGKGHNIVLDKDTKQLIMDLDVPLIQLGVMAEYNRLKQVYKSLMPQTQHAPQELEDAQ